MDTTETCYGNDVSEARKQFLRTFVSLVKPYSFLYNNLLRGYSKSNDKCLTWAEIGKAMSSENKQYSGDDVRSLWSKLRDKYGKESRKVFVGRARSGAGTDTAPVTSNWFLFDDMYFMEDIIKPKNTSSNFSSVTSPLPPPTHCSGSLLPSTSSSCSSLSLSSASFLQQSPSTSTSSSTNTFLELADPDDPFPAALLAAENFASSIEVPVAVCSQNTTFQNPGTAESLRSAAAQINPTRTVPPCDIGKKRVRQSQEEVDQLKRTKDDLSSLTSSLTSALNSIASPEPATATPPPPLTAAEKAKFSPQVELLIGSVSVALSKVSVEKQVTCIIEMLQVAGKYSE